MKTIGNRAAIAAFAVVAAGCATGPSEPAPGPTAGQNAGCVARASFSPTFAASDARHRAYVASRDTGNITVIDLDRLEIAASFDTCGAGYHMVELTADSKKAFASSNSTGQVDVIDVEAGKVTQRIRVGAEPTHMSMGRDGKLLGVVNEKDNSVSFVDPARDVEIKRLSGFALPHFVRWAPDGRYAYVANLEAHHLTRVDVAKLEIDGTIALDGFDDKTPAPEEGGFADAQIDANGVLWAAHAATGKVMLYDTKTLTKLPELTAGLRPWIVYAEHPFASIEARTVPNHGDRNVAFLDRAATASTVATGEPESFGVNYSPLAPNKAFVMNRVRQEIAVIDTTTKKVTTAIPVGGNTETASTTADGRYIVATVSSANRVVVIDAATSTVVKTFDGVGSYPWTVLIPQGQNYCH